MWKKERHRLVDVAPPPALAAVDAVVGEAHLHGRALGVLAAADGLVALRHHDEAPLRTVVEVARLPRLGTFIAWHQQRPPMLVVLADRGGADVVVRRATGVEVHPVEADLDDEEIRHTRPRGWRPERHEHHVEQRWRVAAGQVAEVVRTTAEAVRPRLVVVAGDLRATQLLVDELGAGLDVRVVAGGRAAGDPRSEAMAEAERMLATAVAADTVVLAERLREELGRAEQGCVGMAATVAALRRGAVDTLVLHEPPDDDRRLFHGTMPAALGVSADEVAALGEEPHAGRAVDVLIRAAWGSGAAIRMVPRLAGLDDGVGALLRFPLPG